MTTPTQDVTSAAQLAKEFQKQTRDNWTVQNAATHHGTSTAIAAAATKVAQTTAMLMVQAARPS